jgi:Ca-activated chloride channel family protein
MTSRRLLLSLSLVPLAWQTVHAQLAPAADFFNSGAQLYISNNIPAALERVELGLKTYPGDEKLKKLEELLKQQQQQQQQQQDQQKKSDQQKQSDQKDQQKKQEQDQQKQDQQKQDEPKQSDPNQGEEPKPQEQKKDSGDKPKDEKPDQPAPGQPVKPGEMTPEEAKRLLDAQKGNEQLLQWKPEEKPRNPLRPVKDW